MADRLISADRFKNWLMENYVLYDGDRSLKNIDEQPTVDAVPVVRCKDCVLEQGCKVGQRLGADGYCSMGERREDEMR